VDSESIEVIGVVAATDTSPTGARPTFYRPFPQEYGARMTAFVRARGDTDSIFARIRQTIRDVNQDLSIVDLQTVDHALGTLASQRRIPATVFAVVGLLALLLSAVGLYGVMAYSVCERARELGIRLALGARPGSVRRLVLRQGLVLVGTGLTLGGGAAVLFSKILRWTLFGVGATDPLMLFGVGMVLALPALAALYFPARWASAVEPAQILRRD
jgi:ABC-type antimicrobial peptide transport system permease subunit